MKTKAMKRALTLIVCLAMVLSMSITTAFASTPTVVTDFAGLKAAIENGGEITLGANINLEEELRIQNTVVINLNGKTLTNTTDIWETNPDNAAMSLLAVYGGSLTINGDGNVTAKANDCYAISVMLGGTCTINGGSYVGNISAIQLATGEVVINGGDFSLSQTMGSGDPYRYTLNCIDDEYVGKTAILSVKGGTFENYDPGNNLAEGEGTNFLADGYISVQDEDSYYVVPEQRTEATAPAVPTVTPDKVATGVDDEAKAAIKDEGQAVIDAIVADGTATGVDDATVEAVKQALIDEKTITTAVVASNVDVSKVDKTDIEKITAEVKKSAGTTKAATIVQYIDLGVQLKAGNETLGNVTKLSEPVEFTIAVPSNVEASGRTFYVVKLHDGVATKLDTVLKNGLLTFKTDEFSTYALVYEETATADKPAGSVTQPKEMTGTTGVTGTTGNTGAQTGTVKTGDATDMSLYLGMSLVAMLAALGLIFKKLRTNK